MTKPTPKTPAFTIGKVEIFHSYKDDEPLSYWYRTTPDKNGIQGRSEDGTGAFDVRDLEHPNEPRLTSPDDPKNWDSHYAAYRSEFLKWVRDAVKENLGKVHSITLK